MYSLNGTRCIWPDIKPKEDSLHPFDTTLKFYQRVWRQKARDDFVLQTSSSRSMRRRHSGSLNVDGLWQFLQQNLNWLWWSLLDHLLKANWLQNFSPQVSLWNVKTTSSRWSTTARWCSFPWSWIVAWPAQVTQVRATHVNCKNNCIINLCPKMWQIHMWKMYGNRLRELFIKSNYMHLPATNFINHFLFDVLLHVSAHLFVYYSHIFVYYCHIYCQHRLWLVL